MTDEDLKALVASNALLIQGLGQSIAALGDRLEETRQLVESNARAIQAADTKRERERIEFKAALDDLHQFVRSLTFRALENLAQHEDFVAAMREFRDAMADFKNFVREQN